MASDVLIDSNIYIGWLRQGIDPADALAYLADTTDLVTCGMVRMEVLRGIRNPRIRDRMAAFFDIMQNVGADDKLWRESTQLAWEFDRQGKTLPAQDILIACSAQRLGALVLTKDHHFHLIPKLRVLQTLDGMPPA